MTTYRTASALYSSVNLRLVLPTVIVSLKISVRCGHCLQDRERSTLLYCERAAALFQQLGDGYGEAATVDSLGYAHHHLGNYTQAVDCYRHAMALYRRFGERYYQADTLTHLGDTYQAADDPAAARDAWQQALDILTELDHPDADDIRSKLDSLTD